MAALSRNADFAVQQSNLSSELSTKIAPTEFQEQSGYHQLEAYTSENSSQYNDMYDSKDNSVYPTGRIHSYPTESNVSGDISSATYQPTVSNTTNTSYQPSNSSYFQDGDSKIADRPAQSTAYTKDPVYNSYSQQRYSNSDGSFEGYSSRHGYSNEVGYDRSYSQEAGYNERFSDQHPNSYNQGFNRDSYQSNSQDYPYSNYSRQHQNYSRGNYSYQNSTQGYEDSSDSHPHSGHDRRYRQDTPTSYVQDYHGDRTYNHENQYSQPYDSGYDRGRSYQSKHEDLQYSKPKRSPERERDHGRKESNSSDDFVQRRSAILKRAQVHDGSKHTKASRGPQIVQPHRLSDSSDAKKGDKSKQSEFPKRKLDSFKIPKKKSAISASSPIKQSVPIPALGVKEQEKIEHIKFSQTLCKPPSATVVQTSTNYTTVVSNTTNKLSNLTAKAAPNDASIETDKVIANKPDHLVIGSPCQPAISKSVPSKSTGKKTQSSSSAGKAKTQRSTKANVMPTILSTLDPKTLMSLAVTLQKSIEKAKADKSALTSSNPPVPAHTSFTASVNSPGIKPPTSVHGSSTASLVPKQATFATALPVPVPSPAVVSNQLTSTINSILSAVVSKTPACTNTPQLDTTTLTTQNISSIYSPSGEIKPSTHLIAEASFAAPIASTKVYKPAVTSDSTNVDIESSQGVVLATVITASSTPSFSRTAAKPIESSVGKDPQLPIATASLLSTISIDSKNVFSSSNACSSLLVNTLCTTSCASTIPTSTPTALVLKTEHSLQQQTVNVEVAEISQSNEGELARKRAWTAEESEDTSTISSAKRMKPDNVNDKTLSTVPVVFSCSETQEMEKSPTASKLENKFVNGKLSKPKPEPKSRRKSGSRSKKKVSASKFTTRSSITTVCCFCHKKDSEFNLGFLFGPYTLKTAATLLLDGAESNGLIGTSNSLWIHEECAVWTPGVCLVGSQLIGFQEAISDAENMVCVECKESGATLCCSTHSCKKYYHYHCASVVDCYFDKEKFLVTCPKHSTN